MTETYGAVNVRRALVIFALLVAAGLAACEVERKDRALASRSQPQTEEPLVLAAGPEVLGVDTAAPEAGAEPVNERPIPENVSYGEAEAVFRTGDYEEAARLFEAYASRRPENPWGHYMLGISLWRAGDHAGAEAALRRTLEVDSTHEKALVNLARVLLEQGRASDALEYAEAVVESKPENGSAWRVLGNARSDLGMVQEAVEAYRRAIVLDHRDAWTMNNLGLLMIREGRYEEALPPLARATELRPDVARFQNNLGVALERTGHLPEAAQAFRAALDADPGYEKARVSLERVEARVAAATTSPTPLDLIALAGAFSAEVERWKEEASGPRGVGSEEASGVTGQEG
jgi:Flp pilus assembly protein TadD